MKHNKTNSPKLLPNLTNFQNNFLCVLPKASLGPPPFYSCIYSPELWLFILLSYLHRLAANSYTTILFHFA